MNTETDLLTRLLRLFPVQFIKQTFNVTGSNQSEIIESIIQQNTPAGIRNFAMRNFNSTKQHIYIFSLNKAFNRNSFDTANFPISIHEETVNNGLYEFRCLPIINFNTIVIPFEEAVIEYVQPMIFKFDGKKLIIQCTILEKNLNFIFGDGRRIVDVKKSPDEAEIIASVIDFLTNNYEVNILDLNRGVKYLWDNDFIDSKYAKWKKDCSAATETMDEGYTLKTQYPDVYNNLMSSPLNKTIFKYLREDRLFCNHFTVDATKGQLSVPLFPDTDDQIKNIINEILTNN